MMPRLLVKVGRSRDLVGFYDDAFSSPENMADRYSNLAFVDLAPTVAIALQQVGRVNEGARIVLTADRMCRRGMQDAHPPRSFRVSCPRLWAVLGYKNLSIATLGKAVADGWRPVDAEYPSLADQPEYAVIRNDPQIQRLNAVLAGDAARERRELLAAGL
jgi:hypothetical protein